MQRTSPSTPLPFTNNHITTLYITPVLMKNHSFGASLLRIPNSETEHHDYGHPEFFYFPSGQYRFLLLLNLCIWKSAIQ